MKWLLLWVVVAMLTVFLSMHGIFSNAWYYVASFSLVETCLLVFIYENIQQVKSYNPGLSNFIETWAKIQEIQEVEGNILISLQGLATLNETNLEALIALQNSITALKQQNSMLNERIIVFAKEHESTHSLISVLREEHSRAHKRASKGRIKDE